CHLLSRFISFLYSSRRRHTRFSRDWSSDVCSSDLFLVRRREVLHVLDDREAERHHRAVDGAVEQSVELAPPHEEDQQDPEALHRSEERRVGREGSPSERGSGARKPEISRMSLT